MYTLFKKRLEKIEERIKPILVGEYGSLRHTVISSCIKRYLPQVDSQQYVDDFIKKVLINQALAWEEQNDLYLLNLNNIIIKQAIKYPTIFVSFHFSSYRLGLVYLLTQGHPITLIASNEVIQTQFKDICSLHKRITGKPIDIIDANSPNSFFLMRSKIKEGRSLFAYLDGNTGADGMKVVNKNLIELKFLESSIMIRKGMALISYLCNTSITPIFCKRDSTTNIPIIFTDDPMFPIIRETKDEYVNRVLCKLYDKLQKLVSKEPENWEGWLYIYKFMPRRDFDVLPDSEVEEKKEHIKDLRFNDKDYIKYSNKSLSLVLNKISLKSFDLSHIKIDCLNSYDYLLTLREYDIYKLIKNRILL